jgi:hypothetical protein
MTSTGRLKAACDVEGVIDKKLIAVKRKVKAAHRARGKADFAGEGKGVTPSSRKGNFQLELKDKVEV